MKKQFGLTDTKLFHFHMAFKKGAGGDSSEPPEPFLDPPLRSPNVGQKLYKNGQPYPTSNNNLCGIESSLTCLSIYFIKIVNTNQQESASSANVR